MSAEDVGFHLKRIGQDIVIPGAIGVQERFCDLITGFAKMQPCYTRTSLTDREIADRLSATGTKIDKLKVFLATKGR